jgi:pimeloyl-ACP methyl ester carboxylesterase
LVVLLHGFPELWIAWDAQINALAAAGFRVVAPDMRGYNLSSRPVGIASYATPRLAGDVRDLIHERGAERAMLAGHDWGGEVAWATAKSHPEVVERLAILDALHPNWKRGGLRAASQFARFWYKAVFQLPWLPERIASARQFQALRRLFERDARPGAFSTADIDRYIEAWSQPGAVTAMINYYRASFREPRWDREARTRPVTAPTLVIWGQRDRYLGAKLAEPNRADVPHLERVIYLQDASHWVTHDEPAEVSRLLIEFFSGNAATTP